MEKISGEKLIDLLKACGDNNSIDGIIFTVNVGSPTKRKSFLVSKDDLERLSEKGAIAGLAWDESRGGFVEPAAVCASSFLVLP